MANDGIRAGGDDEYVHIRDLVSGDRVRLEGDILAEIVDNPNDGMWIVVRYVEPASDDVQVVMVDQVRSKMTRGD